MVTTFKPDESWQMHEFRSCRLEQARSLSGEVAVVVRDAIDRLTAGLTLSDVPGVVVALALALATFPEACSIVNEKAVAFESQMQQERKD